ncbi:MAG: TerB family tellurite resistance protein [Pseudomonadota bacterium]
MFDTLKQMLGGSREPADIVANRAVDKKLAAAALMVHVIAADGIITEEEDDRLRKVLHDHYDVTASEADTLAAEAKAAQDEAIDLYDFTSVLKRDMDEDDRILLVEDLWEMVFADGELHEFEDNVVWRVAELLGVHARHRMVLKQRVQARLEK